MAEKERLCEKKHWQRLISERPDIHPDQWRCHIHGKIFPISQDCPLAYGKEGEGRGTIQSSP
jgi:hypothetical protein